ncbi:MAG: hypothetical protein U0797_03550 [Gemmataceae bacterium]
MPRTATASPRSTSGQRDQVFNMTYERQGPDEGRRLVEEYQIKSKMSCNACHR